MKSSGTCLRIQIANCRNRNKHFMLQGDKSNSVSQLAVSTTRLLIIMSVFIHYISNISHSYVDKYVYVHLYLCTSH